MKTIDEIYQDYLDMPYYRRVSQGRKEVETIKWTLRRELEKECDDGNLTFLIIMLCRDFIAADGEFSVEEYEYLKDVFEFSATYNDVLDDLNHLTIDQRMQAKRIIRGADDDTKFSILRFAVLICVADGLLTVSEKREIEKFFEF